MGHAAELPLFGPDIGIVIDTLPQKSEDAESHEKEEPGALNSCEGFKKHPSFALVFGEPCDGLCLVASSH